MLSPSRNKGECKMEIIEAVNWLKDQGVQKNERTGHLDKDGVQLRERGVNTLRFDFVVRFNKKSSILNKAMRSEDMPTYKPFEYIKGDYSDELDRICECVKSDTSHKNEIIREWLLNVARSMVDVNNGKALIFRGPQCIGKTSWFRSLLPESLLRYYGEIPFANSADFRIFKREKVIINNPHLNGIMSALKKNVNSQTALCGTTNEYIDSNAYMNVIDVIEVDYEMYNAIDKSKLLNQMVSEATK